MNNPEQSVEEGASRLCALSAAPTPLPVTNGTEADLAIQGWDDHGLFKDAPEALKLFDEIEEERDRHLVGSK
jgi:hypothetical protein